MQGLKTFPTSLFGDLVDKDCDDARIRKVAILPFRVRNGDVQYLIAAPSPKINKGDILPYSVARGTRDGVDHNGLRVDLKCLPEGSTLPNEVRLEQTAATAVREAEEELGLSMRGRAAHLMDAGVIKLPGKPYPMQLFVLPVESNIRPGEAEDSEKVTWATRATIDMKSKYNGFNPDYLPIIQAVDDTIARTPKLLCRNGKG